MAKIVRFANGKFAVRRWFFGWEYLSLCGNYWWPQSSACFPKCVGDFPTVIGAYLRRYDKGRPVDLDQIGKEGAP